MSYIDAALALSQKNQFEYDYKSIYKQVKKAMEKSGPERDQALRDVLKLNYVSDVKKYEPMRQNMTFDTMGLSGRAYKQMFAKLELMAKAPVFLEEYITLIQAMIVDIDSNYVPEFMLGMNSTEVKDLVDVQLNAYTRYEQAKHNIQSTGFQEALVDVGISRKPSYSETVLKYASATETEKGNMMETYIRMEIVKKDLKDMGFFKRYFSSKGREMRNFVSAAESALRDVEFPKEAEEEARREFQKPTSRDENYVAFHQYIDKKYERQSDGKIASSNQNQAEKDVQNAPYNIIGDDGVDNKVSLSLKEEFEAPNSETAPIIIDDKDKGAISIQTK